MKQLEVLRLGASLMALSWATCALAAEPDGALDEVVVTARRQAENLQDVPQTVVPLSAKALQDLDIRKLPDIENVVPGLKLAGGSGAQVAMRGIAFNNYTSGDSTIAFYLNDAPFGPVILLQGMFDVGQVEVLRGPQGTTRGVSAPSGAITLTTRRPDMSNFGGYVDGGLTNQHGRNLEGGVSVPIIPDVLAVRVAGFHQEDEGPGARSIHVSDRPRVKTDAGRISLRFTPNESLEANLMYQHLERRDRTFLQVFGPGDGNTINPPIAPSQRLSVVDLANTERAQYELVTGQVDYEALGHQLSYVGSYGHGRITRGSPQDEGNVLPGLDTLTTVNVNSESTSQEIRLSSVPKPGRFFDYTVGAYYSWTAQGGDSHFSGQYLPGAFGAGATPNLAAFNRRYYLDVLVQLPQTYQETSIFGSATLHLTRNTELTGGVRHSASIFKGDATLITTPAFIALPPAFLGLPNCALAGFASTYPGVCDIPVPAQLVGDVRTRTSERPTIYTVSLSHRFTPDLMVYANTGTSYQRPTATLGLRGAFATSNNPLLRQLAFHPAQKSTSYEVGFKWTFLEDRGRLNVAAFRQSFRDFQIVVPSIQFLDPSVNPPVRGIMNFPTTVDAKVRGVDVEGDFKVTPEWYVGLQASYSTGNATGTVPCNVFGSNGQPVYNTGGIVSFCNGGGEVNRYPKWNATLRTNYDHEVSSNMTGFVRALVNYNPKNTRASPTYTVPSYALVNLYAGVRSDDERWELTLFVKNALNDKAVLDRSEQPIFATGLGSFPTLNRSSGYYTVASMTPQREVGVAFRYQWGSR